MNRQRVEIVERKGIGHPDYLADLIAENYSKLLCREYMEHCGRVLHHNVDKVEIVGGETKTRFGGGHFIRPMLVFFSGRATDNCVNHSFEIEAIAKRAAVESISEVFSGETLGSARPLLDANDESQVLFSVHTKRGKAMLESSLLPFPPRANDSFIGSGYAPMSQTEEMVYGVERFLNSGVFKQQNPFSGFDVKVTGTRVDRHLSLTVALAFVDTYVSGVGEYVKQKRGIAKKLRDYLRDNLSPGLDEESMDDVRVNTMDDERAARRCEMKGNGGEEHLYLTVTGTSAEQGDDGAVGRGNRALGVSSFSRPISIGSIAGKNPVSHVGKLYTVLAFITANKIYRQLADEGVEEVYVEFVSQIGRRVTDPRTVHVRIISERLCRTPRRGVEEIVRSQLKAELGREIRPGQNKLCVDLVDGRHRVF